MDELWPGKTWKGFAIPDAEAPAIERVAAEARRIHSYAYFVAIGGNALIQEGQVGSSTGMQSVRKSLMNALMGLAVAAGYIRLDATMLELGIDDTDGLSDAERCATVRDCLMGRSGIYHPAAYEPLGLDGRRPARESYVRGEHWFYNNWDFNVLSTIFRQATGLDVFEAFAKWFAEPIEMEDFDPQLCSYFSESVSSHPAYLFCMSARDLARFGLLYLREGKWKGQSLVSAEWIEDSIIGHSQATDGYEHFTTSFGLLWWNMRIDLLRGYNGFSALGGSGHGLIVIPTLDVVIVHRNLGESSEPNWQQILPLIGRTIEICERLAI